MYELMTTFNIKVANSQTGSSNHMRAHSLLSNTVFLARMYATRFNRFVGCCSEEFIVCPIKHAAVLMNMDGTHKTIPLDDDVS